MPTDTKIRHSLTLMLIGTFLVSLSTAMNGALYNNFLKVMLSGNYMKMGQVEAVRETPGILSAFLSGVGSFLPEPVLGAISLVVMGLGFAGYYWATSFTSIMGWSFFNSLGMHLWMPLSGALGMGLAPENQKGTVLGRIASIGAVGTLTGYLVVAGLSRLMPEGVQSFYRYLYFIAGFIAIIAAIVIFSIKVRPPLKPKPKFIFKKKYGLYYLLQILEGCRKQVFITFATFTLVLNYNAGPGTMAVLLFINYLVAFGVSPLFGKWIDRFGEKKVLTWNYLLLIIVFILYSVIHVREVLYVLFCMDNILFTFSIALTTYVGKIAPQEELTGTLAMGVSVNHVAAVIVPLVGFAAWKLFGYEVCFMAGALVVIGQLILVQKMKLPENKTAV